MKNFISVIMPTHNHAWELYFTLFSLEKQYGIGHNEYEIIIVNTNPDDIDTLDTAKHYHEKFKNIRLIQVYDEKASTIKAACYGGNLGARTYAKGDLLVLVVDSARIPTPGVLIKTRSEFEKWGENIVTTTVPYHFLKHYSTPGFTVEECRKAFLKTRWRQDIYHLFDYAAHTNISKSGIFNESCYLGITKKNFIKVNGYNEIFTEWSDYNLDLWRRLTRNPPKDGIQIPDEVNDHWGKIGLGLEIHALSGEADFHLHHSLSDAKRIFSRRLIIDSWNEYGEVGDCIKANINRPDWGTGKAEEVKFEE